MDPYVRLRTPAIWDRLLAGAELAERGAWWHAHEAWEAAWRAYHGPDRGVVQGLIQLVAANHHLAHGRRAAAAAVLARARRRLREAGDARWPLPLDELARGADQLLAELVADGCPQPMAVRLTAGLRSAH